MPPRHIRRDHRASGYPTAPVGSSIRRRSRPRPAVCTRYSVRCSANSRCCVRASPKSARLPLSPIATAIRACTKLFHKLQSNTTCRTGRSVEVAETGRAAFGQTEMIASLQSIQECVDTSLCHHGVLLASSAPDAHCADDLTVDDNGNPAQETGHFPAARRCRILQT